MEVSPLWSAHFVVTQANLDVGEWFLWVPTTLGLLLAVCPLVYVITKPGSPTTQGLTEPKQLISGKGFRLEVSTLSLLILCGVILALSGIAYKTYSGIQDVSNLKKDNAVLEDEVRRERKITVVIHLKLPQTSKAPPIRTLRCSYRSNGKDYVEGQVTEGIGDQDVGCKIADIGRDEVLSVKVEQELDKGGHRKLGSCENVRILEPSYDLKE